jgi:hypothetical protein
LHCSLTFNKQVVETPTCLPIDEWSKESMVYMHSGIVSVLEKEDNLAICDNMDKLKQNKPDREMQRLHAFTYVRNLKTSNA